MNTYEERINQSGIVQCPFCGNKIEWRCKVGGMWIDGRMANYIDSQPVNVVFPVFTDKGKVRFNIGCEVCRFCIETEPMDLIKQ